MHETNLDATPRLPDQRVHPTGEGCLFVLEDEGVFFSAARQELYVFNTSATLLWCSVEEGMSTDAMIQAYGDAFGLGPAEATNHLMLALDQWWGLGYIEAPTMDGLPASSFATALARVLSNERLRDAFAHAPQETARRLRLEDDDLAAFLALDAWALNEEATRLQERPRRRQPPLAGADTLFAAVTDDGRTVLETAVCARLRGLGAAPIERHYRLLGTTFCVRFAAVIQEALVHPALAHLTVAPPSEIDIVLDLVVSDGGHVILDGLIPIGYCQQLEQLTPAVKNAIALAAINRYQFFVELHAGVVANGERCVLLPGASGSGKTTLTAGLTQAGFSYFSDEVALLEEGTLALRPFPLALGVKPGALASLEKRWPEVSRLQAHARVDGERVRYLAPPHACCAPAQTRAVAGWLIFPRYAAGLQTALRPISQSEALRRLLQECMVLPQRLDAARVEKLVQWMRTLQCYELPMSSLDRAVELVVECCRG